jgi:hypothetical protein
MDRDVKKMEEDIMFQKSRIKILDVKIWYLEEMNNLFDQQLKYYSVPKDPPRRGGKPSPIYL